MRLEDSDWQGKTEGEGYVHVEKPKYWSVVGEVFLLSFMKSCHYLVLNIECGEWDQDQLPWFWFPGFQWKNWGSWRTLKKSPGSSSIRRQVSDLWMPYGGLTKEESKGDAKGQVTNNQEPPTYRFRRLRMSYMFLSSVNKTFPEMWYYFKVNLLGKISSVVLPGCLQGNAED